MTEQEAFKAVAETISDRTECDIATIKSESTFRDLGIDSLDTVDLLMDLEDKLGMSIELDQKITTIGELVTFITSQNWSLS